MSEPRVLGIAGWSGSGKTTLIIKLLPLLAKRGVRVATLKHAHHAFDVDVPGKDSYEHRKAGARMTFPPKHTADGTSAPTSPVLHHRR